MFSNDKPIRPPRRRRSHSRGPPNDEMTGFCGQFPNRLKRNFSTDFLPQNNEVFQTIPKRSSNLEINRTLSQNAFVSPFVPLFGPNIHPLMGQMWKPLRHTQTQVILPNRWPSGDNMLRPEPKHKEPQKKTIAENRRNFETFEDHFNQYKSERKTPIKEPKEPEIDLIQRKSVFGTLKDEKRGVSCEQKRKASLQNDLKKEFEGELKRELKIIRREKKSLGDQMDDSLVYLVIGLNIVLMVLIYFLLF